MELPGWAIATIVAAVTGTVALLGRTLVQAIDAAVKAWLLRVERHIAAGHELRNRVSEELAKIHLARIDIERKVGAFQERLDDANTSSLDANEEVERLKVELARLDGRLDSLEVLLRGIDSKRT